MHREHSATLLHGSVALNIGLESRAVRLRSEAAQTLISASRWLVVPTMLLITALLAQVAVAGVDYLGRNYPHVTLGVPDYSVMGRGLVAASVIALVIALTLAVRLSLLLIERLALRHYRYAVRQLVGTDTAALIASGGLWDLVQALIAALPSGPPATVRPATLDHQLSFAAAFLPFASCRPPLNPARCVQLLRQGNRLLLSNTLPVRRATVLAGWLLVIVGLPCIVGLSFTYPALAMLSAIALALLGALQLSSCVCYCGRLAALCDFFRGELPAYPRIWA